MSTWSVARVPSGRPLAQVAVVGVLVGIAAWVLDWRLLVPLGLGLPVVAAVLARDGLMVARVPRPGGRSTWLEGASGLHGPRFLGGALAAMFFASSLKLLSGKRDALEAASGNLSPDNALELLATVVLALPVLSVLRRGWPARIPSIALAYVGYAVIALLSVSWSILPLFSAARAFQFTILAAFVAYACARASTETGLVDDVLVHFFRYVTFGVVILAVRSVALGALSLERFTFTGAHPNGATLMMAAVCLAVVFSPDRRRITAPLPWWLVPLGLLPLIYSTGSRANVAAALVGLGAGWFIVSLGETRIGGLGLGAIFVAVGASLGFASEWVASYAIRGQSTEALTGLNGRIEVWQHVLANPVGNEVWGIGVGATRSTIEVGFSPDNAHSVWIDVLSSLGVIGLAALGAVVVSLLVMALWRRSPQGAWVATLVAVGSVNSVTISQPGAALVLLLLGLVIVSDTSSQDRAAGAVSPRVA